MAEKKRLGDLIIASLKEAIAFEHEGRTDLARVVTRTARDTEVTAPPGYTPERIAAIRQALGFSQAVFAKALNVSTPTVRSWEQGIRRPGGPSLRLLQFAETCPQEFGAFLRDTSSRPVAAPHASR